MTTSRRWLRTLRVAAGRSQAWVARRASCSIASVRVHEIAPDEVGADLRERLRLVYDELATEVGCA